MTRTRRNAQVRKTLISSRDLRTFGVDEERGIRGQMQRGCRRDNSSVPVNQDRNTRQRVRNTSPSPEPHFLPTGSAKRTRVSLLCLEAAAFLGGRSLRKIERLGGRGDTAESPGTFPTAENEGKCERTFDSVRELR